MEFACDPIPEWINPFMPLGLMMVGQAVLVLWLELALEQQFLLCFSGLKDTIVFDEEFEDAIAPLLILM